jgi:hypothetical protein
VHKMPKTALGFLRAGYECGLFEHVPEYHQRVSAMLSLRSVSSQDAYDLLHEGLEKGVMIDAPVFLSDVQNFFQANTK